MTEDEFIADCSNCSETYTILSSNVAECDKCGQIRYIGSSGKLLDVLKEGEEQ